MTEKLDYTKLAVVNVADKVSAKEDRFEKFEFAVVVRIVGGSAIAERYGLKDKNERKSLRRVLRKAGYSIVNIKPVKEDGKTVWFDVRK